jgi:hypothetical protein
LGRRGREFPTADWRRPGACGRRTRDRCSPRRRDNRRAADLVAVAAGGPDFENLQSSGLDIDWDGLDYHSVELKDDLTVSPLQARLNEPDLPINVEVGVR